MKRTPKSGDQNRDSVFRFRVTQSEKKLIRELSAQYGYRNVSKFLRSLITGDNASSCLDRQTLLVLQAELSKEGSNLNQIAKAINIRMLNGEAINICSSRIDSTLDNIDHLTYQILEILKNVRIRKN